jgi:hypothetical protein
VRLMDRGVHVWPLDRDDKLEPNFRVSGSPADMPASGGSGDGPCHFLFIKNDKALELHLGLKHEGVSETTHEIDLSVIQAGHGRALRHAGGGPVKGPTLVGLELKAYSDRYKLDHGIPRALLGIAIDLDPWWPMQAWTLHTPGGGSSQMHRSDRMQLAVLTSTQLHDSSEKYLGHHGAGSHSLVMPSANEGAIDEVVDQIVGLLS